jgi:hypothetical protein
MGGTQEAWFFPLDVTCSQLGNRPKSKIHYLADQQEQVLGVPLTLIRYFNQLSNIIHYIVCRLKGGLAFSETCLQNALYID